MYFKNLKQSDDFWLECGTSISSSSDYSFDLLDLFAVFIKNFTDRSIGVLLSCSIDNLITYNSFKFLKN